MPVKSRSLTIRQPEDLMRLFQKLAYRRETSMNELLTKMIRREVEQATKKGEMK